LALEDGAVDGASTHSVPLDQQRGLRLWSELVILFIAGPIAVALAMWHWRLPLPPFLLALTLIIVLVLLRDREFSFRSLFGSPIPTPVLGSIVLLLPGAAAVVFGLAWLIEPDRFLTMPRDRFGLWLAVMVLYPLIPVVAQEIIYRVFFWHRYSALFAGRPWLAIVVNAALFGFAHIVMRNWIAVILSFFAGLVFAWRYQRSRSFWAVVLEHGLYGDMIFTAGLGLYFFSGALR
jgi:uncharacterized protein